MKYTNYEEFKNYLEETRLKEWQEHVDEEVKSCCFTEEDFEEEQEFRESFENDWKNRISLGNWACLHFVNDKNYEKELKTEKSTGSFNLIKKGEDFARELIDNGHILTDYAGVIDQEQFGNFLTEEEFENEKILTNEEIYNLIEKNYAEILTVETGDMYRAVIGDTPDFITICTIYRN